MEKDMESGYENMKFKLGDEVEVVSLRRDMGEHKYFEIGFTGRIKDFRTEDTAEGNKLFYDVEEEDCEMESWWVSEDSLKLVKEETPQLSEDTVYFAKVKPDAIIPSKRDEDAGYDIYPLFEENHIEIQPHETVLIPTGIASAFDKKYRFELWERGSTGTKGIGQRCGVFDSGFRGEWKVPVTNHNEIPLVIVKDENIFYESYAKSVHIIYPYSKAICQALLDVVPKVDVHEMAYNELLKIESKRGEGMLGSSGK